MSHVVRVPGVKLKQVSLVMSAQIAECLGTNCLNVWVSMIATSGCLPCKSWLHLLPRLLCLQERVSTLRCKWRASLRTITLNVLVTWSVNSHCLHTQVVLHMLLSNQTFELATDPPVTLLCLQTDSRDAGLVLFTWPGGQHTKELGPQVVDL